MHEGRNKHASCKGRNKPVKDLTSEGIEKGEVKSELDDGHQKPTEGVPSVPFQFLEFLNSIGVSHLR